MTEQPLESGHEFELRALALARAIHDPFGLQGAIMHKGRERDAVFVSQDDIHVYEFTIEQGKAKAEKDASKLKEILTDLGSRPENSYKSLTGWFVTRDEPTAHQRDAVKAQSGDVRLHAISVSTLQQRICNSELYLHCRDNAPFGSTAYLVENPDPNVKVEVSFSNSDGENVSNKDLINKILEGERSLISGDFGVGKSHALWDLYLKLRREHFRRKKLTPFPVHINLRECAGLKTPAEILRRHAEEIGFQDDKSLISAWRSGSCVLLLDGFDEIVPVRWLGGASDLRNVRWEALAPVRRLIEESPSGTGIVISGRSQYFSSAGEMLDVLGLSGKSNVFTLSSFTDEQVAQYLELAGVHWQLPEWLPSRPLLLGYLLAMGNLENLSFDEASRAASWRSMFDAICRRESKPLSAVRPETIKEIVSRIATLARSQGSATGPISMELMRTAFVDVNNRQPDEEGMQLLLRLPGLVASNGSAISGERIFADQELADTAYGEDLANYLIAPFGEHPLQQMASWVNASSDLGIGVAANSIGQQGVTTKAILSIANQRQNAGQFDAVLSDILMVADSLDVKLDHKSNSFLIEGVIFDRLVLGDETSFLSCTSFNNCLFQIIDASGIDQNSKIGYFKGGLIGRIEGLASLPNWLNGHFVDIEVGEYSAASQTTSGILQLNLPLDIKIALTILKKIYAQRGAGRKEGALFRGLDAASKQHVPAVISRLLSDGWIHKQNAGKTTIYLPVRNRRTAAMRVLETPSELRLGT